MKRQESTFWVVRIGVWLTVELAYQKFSQISICNSNRAFLRLNPDPAAYLERATFRGIFSGLSRKHRWLMYAKFSAVFAFLSYLESVNHWTFRSVVLKLQWIWESQVVEVGEVGWREGRGRQEDDGLKCRWLGFASRVSDFQKVRGGAWEYACLERPGRCWWCCSGDHTWRTAACGKWTSLGFAFLHCHYPAFSSCLCGDGLCFPLPLTSLLVRPISSKPVSCSSLAPLPFSNLSIISIQKQGLCQCGFCIFSANDDWHTPGA